MDLKNLREAAGIPRIRLADEAGVSRFRLYEAERGVRALTLAELAAIEKVLAPALPRSAQTVHEFQSRIRTDTSQIQAVKG